MDTVLAGGGTGGHLFPAIAIAQAIQSRHPGSRVLFVGSGRPLEMRILSAAGFAFKRIPVEGMKGRGLWRQVKVALALPVAFLKSLWIVFRFKPCLAVGVGGYSAGPVVLAARCLGVKVVLHEQNQLPGLTTRLLAPLAHGICLSFPSTAIKAPADRLHVTGNPVRRSLLEDNAGNRPVFSGPSVLVLGGSQGARGINAAMMGAVGVLVEKIPDFHVTHQTGEADYEKVVDAYDRLGFSHTVLPFIEDMGSAYAQADLVVCRAGATTVAEITALGKPAVFIPFPQAASDHQRHNAEALVAAGAAEMILEKDLEAQTLARRIGGLLSDPERLEEMGRQAASLGQPDAADHVVDVCDRLTGCVNQ